MTDKAQSDKERVLAVYPQAVVHWIPLDEFNPFGVCQIYDAADNEAPTMGDGDTENAAWADAASRLPSSPQPTCVCEHAESQHWPESKDQYKLRRCSELGCDCERYEELMQTVNDMAGGSAQGLLAHVKRLAARESR